MQHKNHNGDQPIIKTQVQRIVVAIADRNTVTVGAKTHVFGDASVDATTNTNADVAAAVFIDEVIVEKIFIAKVITSDDTPCAKAGRQLQQSLQENCDGDVGDKVSCELRFVCTPIDVIALVVGALFNEHMITVGSDVMRIEVQGNVVHVVIKKKKQEERVEQEVVVEQEKSKPNAADVNVDFDAGSNLTIEDICQHIRPNARVLSAIRADQLIELMAELHCRQRIFSRTGAAHAAMLVAADGEVLYFAEDIGRHNAVDKVIGKCLLQRGSVPAGCMLILSSRIAFELVHKAARAGIELIAAVSAPSSLAIAAADYWNMTLCGFVRNGKINLYSHPERVISFK